MKKALMLCIKAFLVDILEKRSKVNRIDEPDQIE
jgi:hypothetical protein